MVPESPSQSEITSDRCPLCSSDDLDESIDEVPAVCNNCGFVVDQQSELPEAYTSRHIEEDTSTNQYWRDEYTVTNSTEKRVAKALETLEELGAEFQLRPSLKERAATIFGAAVKQQVTDGRDMDLVITAAVGIAAREEEVPVPLSRLAEEADHERTRLTDTLSTLFDELELDRPVCRPHDYVEPICRDIGLDESVTESALEYIRAAEEEGLTTGRNPTGIAAAAIYSADDHEYSQRDIADHAGVSKETVRVRIRDFREAGVLNDD